MIKTHIDSVPLSELGKIVSALGCFYVRSENLAALKRMLYVPSLQWGVGGYSQPPPAGATDLLYLNTFKAIHERNFVLIVDPWKSEDV